MTGSLRDRLLQTPTNSLSSKLRATNYGIGIQQATPEQSAQIAAGADDRAARRYGWDEMPGIGQAGRQSPEQPPGRVPQEPTDPLTVGRVLRQAGGDVARTAYGIGVEAAQAVRDHDYRTTGREAAEAVGAVNRVAGMTTLRGALQRALDPGRSYEQDMESAVLVGEMGKAIPRTGAELGAGMLTGMDALERNRRFRTSDDLEAGRESLGAPTGLKRAADAIREVTRDGGLAPLPGYEDHFGVNATGAVTSMATFVGPSAAARLAAGRLSAAAGAGPAGTRAMQTGAQFGTAGTMAGLSGVDEYVERYESFLAENPHLDRDKYQALMQSHRGIAPGVVQILNLNRIIGPVIPAGRTVFQRKIADLGVAGLSEFAVEGGGALIQNLEEMGYNPDRQMFDDVLQRGGYGFLAAVVMRAGVQPYVRDGMGPDSLDPNEIMRRGLDGESAEQIQREVLGLADPQKLADAMQRGEFEIDFAFDAAPAMEAGDFSVTAEGAPVEGTNRYGIDLRAEGPALDAFNAHGLDLMDMSHGGPGLQVGGQSTGAEAASESPAAPETGDVDIRAPRPEAGSMLDQEPVAPIEQGLSAEMGQPTAPVNQETTTEFLTTPDRPDVQIPRAMVLASDLQTDAAAYQYKAGGDAEGVTDRLQGVKQWDDLKSGRVVVHERADGGRFVADGHQRLGLARRLEDEGHAPIQLDAIVLREADGFSTEDARVYAAAKNIAEGTGTAWDAAKIFREGAGRAGLADSLPPSSAIVRDGRRLANLSEEATQAAINAEIDPAYAGIAADRFRDSTEQMGAIQALARFQPTTQGQAHALMEDLAAAGVRADQSDLFGGLDDSVMQERMKIIDRVRSRVLKDRAIMAGLVRNQATIEGAAQNVVGQAGSDQARQEAETIARLIRHISTNPELNQYVTEQARQVADGELKRGEAIRAVLQRSRASLRDSAAEPDGQGPETVRASDEGRQAPVAPPALDGADPRQAQFDAEQQVQQRLEGTGQSVPVEQGEGDTSRYPYPTEQEMSGIRAAFDHFFETIETRETESGVQLYSRSDGIGKAAAELAERDELFQFPIPNASDMQAIFAELDPAMDITERKLRVRGKPVTRWLIRTEDAHTVIVTEQGGEIYANLASLEAGRSGGQAIYAGLAHYAHQNNLKFIPDPDGLSEQAVLRRPEFMLSSALKYGTTRHLGVSDELTSPKHQWARPLRWRTGRSRGDYLANLRELMETSYHNVRTLVPEIEGISYNFQARRFEDAEGSEFTDQDFSELSERVRNDYAGSRQAGQGRRFGEGSNEAQRARLFALGEGKAPIGRATLKRAALTHTLVREESGARWRQVLGEITRQQGQGLDPALRQIFYSTAPADAGVSRSSPEKVLAALTPRARRALIDSGLVTVTESPAQWPGSHPADAAGAWINGKIYLAADNIAAGSERGLILHEVGVHHGLKDMLGEQYSTLVRQLQRQVERGGREGASPAQREAYEAHQRALADDTIQGNQEAIWEETIAYMAEAGANSSLFRQVVAAIRNFLRNLGLVRGFTNADVAHLARGSVARIVDGIQGEQGASYAPALYSRADEVTTEAASEQVVSEGQAESDADPVRQEDARDLTERASLPDTIRIVATQAEARDNPLLAGATGPVAAAFDPESNQGIVIMENAGKDASLLLAQKLGYQTDADIIGSVYRRRLLRLVGGGESIANVFVPEFWANDNVRNALERAKNHLRSEYQFAASDAEAARFLQATVLKPERKLLIEIEGIDNGQGREPGDAIPDRFTQPGTSPVLRDKLGSRTLNEWTRFFESAADNLENTTGLEFLGKKIRDFYDGELKHKADAMNLIRDQVNAWKRLSRKRRAEVERAFGNYFKVATYDADNKQSAYDSAPAEAKSLIDAWLAVGKMTGEMNQALGIKVQDGNKWRLIGMAPDFFPRVPSDLTRSALSNPEAHPEHWNKIVDALMAEGLIKSRDEAMKYIRAQSIHNETANDFFSGMEMARKQALPDVFYDWTLTPALNYIEAWATRYSQIEQFGQQTDTTKELFTQVLEDGGVLNERTRRYLKGTQNRIYEYSARNGFQVAIATLNMIATGTQLANFGTATLNLIGGSTLNWLAYGEVAALKAYAELMARPRKTFREMQSIGVLREDVLKITQDYGEQDTVRRIMGTQFTVNPKRELSRAVNLLLKYGGYLPTEHVIRMHGALAGKHYLLAARRADAKGKSQTYRAFAERNGFDFDRLMRENGEYFEKWLRFTSNLTQGTYRIDQTPIFTDTPEGRFLLKYQKFGTQVNRLVWRNHLKPFLASVREGGEKVSTGERVKSFMPIVRFFYATAIGGFAIGSMRELLFDYMRPGPQEDEVEKALERLLDDDERARSLGIMASYAYHQMIQAGAFGFIGNYGQMAKDFTQQTRVKNPLDPPGLSALHAMGDLAITWIGQGKITAKDADRQLESFFSLYRTTKRPLIKALGALDEQNYQYQVQASVKDRRYISGVAARFARDQEISGGRTMTGGQFIPTPMTPYTREIVEAIRAGRPEKARAVIVGARQEMEREDFERLLRSARSSVRSGQPLNIQGRPMSQQEQQEFLRWAKENLSEENFQRIRRARDEYRRSARAARLM